MNKLCYLYVIIFIFISSGQSTFAEEVKMLQGNVSLIDEIPEDFYGTWVVAAVAISNSNPNIYESESVDLWTLSREHNIIVLRNPISGAQASVTINEVENNTIKFSRHSKGDNETGLETPCITLRGDIFDGTDKMVIRRYQNNKLYKEDIVEYRIMGKRISSENIFYQ